MSGTAILALMAHPDDAEICMGGTLARFSDSGYSVHIGLVCVPDSRESRLSEAAVGAKILGASLDLIEFPDTASTSQVEDIPVYKLVRAFDELQRRVRASIIFTHWDGDAHYDHVLVARAALSVTRRQAVDLYMCEQANQHAPLASPMHLDTFADVSKYMDRRIESIRAHRSQVAVAEYEQQVRARARCHGERIGCEYAEAFHCVVQRLKFDRQRNA